MSTRDDPIWRTAWDWVTREHERPLMPDERTDLVNWLKADPAHHATYVQAARLWLLTGLIPPSHPLPDMDS